MDAYEATRVVFSRIQSLDADNAVKIMGLLLLQDHGEKEMIRLAFVPEPTLRSIVLAARKQLGLPPPAALSSSNPDGAAPPAPPFLVGRQNSCRLGASPPSNTSWAPPPLFFCSDSLVNGGAGGGGGAAEDFESSEELLFDEFQLQNQISFLNEGGATSDSAAHGLNMASENAGELFYQDLAGDCCSSSGEGTGMFPSSLAGWPPAPATGGRHLRSSSAAAELYLDTTAGADTGFGWKPCLYFARGYCKNGNSCRFFHGLSDDATVATMAAGSCVSNMKPEDNILQQQGQELLLLKSRSPRQLLVSAFPYSPTGSLPASPSGGKKVMNYLLQNQIESQRVTAAAAVAAASFRLGGAVDSHNFIARGSRMLERSDFAAGMASPSSRQIYLTFPADSTFKEEDVSNYFSIYGPVQDVRIPYQQKRMFGFVSFVYPETVKLILAKGNPHFISDARVLVKPYKEKGKLLEKKQNYPPAERGDFYSSTALTGFDSRDPFEFPQLGTRILYQEALLKRRLEEQQQEAELWQAIELQNKRLIGLRLADCQTRSEFHSNVDTVSSSASTIAPPAAAKQENCNDNQDKDSSHVIIAEVVPSANVVATLEKEREDISLRESNVEHNLPDSPFAAPTEAASSSFIGPMLRNDEASASTTLDRCGSNGDHFIEPSLSPATSPLRHCFLQPMLLPNS